MLCLVLIYPLLQFWEMKNFFYHSHFADEKIEVWTV